MDYHIIGFRECAAEVARYLINIEGMDIQDPLRMRLISHLQCFVAQREISVKPQNAAISPAAWPTAPATAAAAAAAAVHHHAPYVLPHHQSAYGPMPPTALPPSTNTSTHTPILPASATSPMYHQGSGYPSSTSSSSQLNHSNAYTYIPNLPPTVATSGSILCETQTSSSSTAPESSSLLPHQQQQQQQHYSQHEDQNGSTYTDLSSNLHRNAAVSIGYGNPQYPPSGAQGYNSSGAGDGGPTSPGSYNNNNKPYRPWGTGPEMAYWKNEFRPETHLDVYNPATKQSWNRLTNRIKPRVHLIRNTLVEYNQI